MLLSAPHHLCSYCFLNDCSVATLAFFEGQTFDFILQLMADNVQSQFLIKT